MVSRALLAQLGVTWGELPPGAVDEAGWVIAARVWQTWRSELERMVSDGRCGPDGLIGSGVARSEVVQKLGLPCPALLAPLVASCPRLEVVGGDVGLRGHERALGPGLAEALAPLLALLDASPFHAPEAAELAAAGVGTRQLNAAAAADVVLVLPGGIVLRPDAALRAAELLSQVPQPFTLSAARQALGTSRRVAVPLLEHMDRCGLTHRLDAVYRACANVHPPPRSATGGPPDRTRP